jgi:hypothetical protein
MGRADMDMQARCVGGRIQIKEMPHRNDVGVASRVRQRGAMGAQFLKQRVDVGMRARGDFYATHQALSRVASSREVARRVFVVIARVAPQQFRQRVKGVQRRARRRGDENLLLQSERDAGRSVGTHSAKDTRHATLLGMLCAEAIRRATGARL